MINKIFTCFSLDIEDGEKQSGYFSGGQEDEKKQEESCAAQNRDHSEGKIVRDLIQINVAWTAFISVTHMNPWWHECSKQLL